MADSDDEYIQNPSDEDHDGQTLARNSPRCTRSRPRGAGKEAEWEVSLTWEGVTEDADGTITGTVEGLLEAGKRKRCPYHPKYLMSGLR